MKFYITGVLDDVKTAFNIDKSQQGLLQTVFVISYMVFAPIFGYMGDRYSRRVIMAFGVLLWSITTLAGSFMVRRLLVILKKNIHFWMELLVIWFPYCIK